MGTERLDNAFDRDLRHALGAVASVAPLPDGVLRIPPRWIGRRRTATAFLTRSLAFGATVAAGVLIVSQLSHIVPIRSVGMSADQAAARAGVPVQHVLRTKDGYAALKLESRPQPVLELLLVPADDASVRRLAFATFGPRDLEDTVVGMSTFRLSCAASSDLAQPNFVFGEVQFAPDAPTSVSLHAPSSGAVSGNLFLFALDPGEAPAGQIDVTTISPKTHLGANWTLPAGSFDHADACLGGPVRPVKDLWRFPIPKREF